MLRLATAALFFVAGLFASTFEAAAQSPLQELTVARGKTVLLRSFAQYQNLRGCTPSPGGMHDTSPKPKLGAIVSRTVSRRFNGACGVQDYPSQYVYYQAGNTPGVDEFTFFLFPSAFFGGTPWRYPYRIKVR